MRATVVVLPAVRAVIEELPPREQALIIERFELLEHFPRMYQARQKGRFRRHRRFVVGDWVVYYRVVEDTVYVRGIWPARIP